MYTSSGYATWTMRREEDARQMPRYMQDSSKAAPRFGTRKQLRGRWLRTCWPANQPVTNIEYIKSTKSMQPSRWRWQSSVSGNTCLTGLGVISVGFTSFTWSQTSQLTYSFLVTLKPADFCLCWRRGIQNHVHDTPPDALAVRSADCWNRWIELFPCADDQAKVSLSISIEISILTPACCNHSSSPLAPRATL